MPVPELSSPRNHSDIVGWWNRRRGTMPVPELSSPLPFHTSDFILPTSSFLISPNPYNIDSRCSTTACFVSLSRSLHTCFRSERAIKAIFVTAEIQPPFPVPLFWSRKRTNIRLAFRDCFLWLRLRFGCCRTRFRCARIASSRGNDFRAMPRRTDDSCRRHKLPDSALLTLKTPAQTGSVFPSYFLYA